MSSIHDASFTIFSSYLWHLMEFWQEWTPPLLPPLLTILAELRSFLGQAQDIWCGLYQRFLVCHRVMWVHFWTWIFHFQLKCLAWLGASHLVGLVWAQLTRMNHVLCLVNPVSCIWITTLLGGEELPEDWTVLFWLWK